MPKPIVQIVSFVVFLGIGPVLAADSGEMDLRQQAEAVERAFAKTMADRDHQAFAGFLSEETIFISGPMALRGKQQVAAQWRAFFDGPVAPFSWAPETIEVLDSGTLALSSGPVRDAQGTLISTFTSVWRQEAPGVWKIVLDKGNPVCPQQQAAQPAPAD